MNTFTRRGWIQLIVLHHRSRNMNRITFSLEHSTRNTHQDSREGSVSFPSSSSSSFPFSPPFLFFRSFLPPSLSSSSSFGREPARILNRDHYLRAIIIPKTNSYFLLRNRKLINQSSLALSLSPAMLLAPLRVARGPGPGV